MIDIEKPNEETGKEEAKGKMEEGRQCFNDPRNVKLVNAAGKECTDTRSFMGTVSRLLSVPDVSTCPLM
jgi:hypothetical protein